ncbi:MAG: hypothetical protein HW404_323, partial [Anaerolineales bacterium]|nr:hypothetical protein [Anaerolineales bacterium]
MLALEWTDGIRLGWLLAGAGVIAAALLTPSRGLRLGFACGAGALTLLAFTAPIPFGITPVAPKELARALQREGAPLWESSHWNPLARIDVVSFGDDRLDPALPLEYKLVTQDGGAPSLLIRPDPTLGRLGEQTIFGIPFWIRPQADVLIIGLALPFFFAGLALATLFATRSTRVSQVYFADLLGAGLGAVVTMLALAWTDGIRLGWLLAGAGVIAAALLAPSRGLR